MKDDRRRHRVMRATLAAVTVLSAVGYGGVQAADRQPIVRSYGPIAPYMGSRHGPDRSLPRDSKGVVLAPYGGTLGNQYNPVTIAQVAIAYYQAIKYESSSDSQKAADKTTFFIQVEWLVSHQSSAGLWYYRFPWAGQPVPWVSAMAQGLAISALIRANNLRPDVRYTNAITKSRSTFERVWAHGGVATWQKVGATSYLVYEEYMPPYSLHTLNGWMYAMVGLYEAWTYLHDPMAKFDLYDSRRGIAALRALLPYYDTGSWSTYNLKSLTAAHRGTLARLHYHMIHIKQLRWFSKITNDSFFTTYANRFQAYLDACTATRTCPP